MIYSLQSHTNQKCIWLIAHGPFRIEGGFTNGRMRAASLGSWIEIDRIEFLNSIFFRYSHKDNLNLTDAAGEMAMTESLKLYKAAGGSCLVDNSTYGMNRNIKFLKTLSQDTGVHIIAGTGIEFF